MRETTKRLAATGALLVAAGGGFLGGHFEGKNTGETGCNEHLGTKNYGYASLTDDQRIEFANHAGDRAFYANKYPDLAKTLGNAAATQLIDVSVFHSGSEQLNHERVASAYPLGDTLHSLAPNIQQLRFTYDQQGEPGVAVTINAASIGC
jgi:hypothetical protein